LNSANYGGGEKRIRAWIVAIETVKSGIPHDVAMQFLKKCEEFILKMKFPPLDFRKILMKASDPYLKKELARLQKACAEKEEEDVDDSAWKRAMNNEIAGKNISWALVQAFRKLLNCDNMIMLLLCQ
jgi:hypothetical protein